MCISKDADYNQQVLDYVLSGDDFKMEVECPNCKKEAVQTNYDSNDGGCINSYYRIDCNHCGHHQCDNDYCSTCEAECQDQYEYNQAYFEYDFWLDGLFDESDISKLIDPVEITNLKLYHQNKIKPICGNDADHLFKKGVKRFLDRRAEDRVLKKIEAAKQEIYAM